MSLGGHSHANKKNVYAGGCLEIILCYTKVHTHIDTNNNNNSYLALYPVTKEEEEEIKQLAALYTRTHTRARARTQHAARTHAHNHTRTHARTHARRHTHTHIHTWPLATHRESVRLAG